MSLNFENLLQIDYISGYFSRNKKIFTASILIFLFFAAVGTLFYSVEDVMGQTKIDQNIKTLKIDGEIFTEDYEKVYYDEPNNDEKYPLNYEEDYFNEGTDVITENNVDITNLFEDYSFEGFITLFLYNFSIDFGCILGGLVFSLPSLIITFVNASQIGVIFSELNFIIILLGIIPHGIFEIPSSVFALSGALMITSFELKIIKGVLSSKTTVKEEIENSIYLIKDAIISVGIVFLLLIIAAFIETFITPILLLMII
ncbi:stage II sporulation protein M [Methanosphaera sp.]|uniref:stage II sporulation protein M n=1 Tax=Methanosphaera sp. TaxID=2666342 RepID=UPI0025FD3392|nr:stage II sporulation protein M [Methanosphaera sp.]